METKGCSAAPAVTASMAVDSVHGRSDGTPFPVSSAPEATSPRQREEPNGQTPDEPPASAQPESGTVTTSSGTPSEFDGGSQQQQGSKDRRKVGLSWTEAEHRQFLQGLEKLGKGDWRGISRQFVTTRTPTQVASHAQKYYIRQTNQNRRKRRASLFDLANPEQAQARSSPRASQATTGASDGELLQSKAESSQATMPEASQSCGPSHSDSMNYLQSGSAAAPNRGSRSLQTQSVACSHSSGTDPRGSSQPDLGALQQREPDFSPCLLGPATVAPPSSLDAYSLGQYAAHHQAAAAAAYATAMQQQAAAAYAQALMHQQASHSMRGLTPIPNPSSGTESVNHRVPDRAAFPSPADSFPGSSDACARSAFRRFQPPALIQAPQQHSSSPQPPAASDSAPSAPTPSSSCYPASTACYPASTSFHPSSSSHMPWQHDAMPSLPAAISHWGHFMSHEPECRPVAEHRGFGMLGFTPSWSAKRPPGMSHNSSVGTWQQSDWGQPHSSALHHSSGGGESSDRAVSPEHVSAAANNAALPSKPAPPSKPSNDRPKAHEQAELPAPSPFGGPSDQPATFANGKLHRPVAARPTLHGLTPPPMFSADDPNQCSNGSSMTHSQRAHH